MAIEVRPLCRSKWKENSVLLYFFDAIFSKQRKKCYQNALTKCVNVICNKNLF